jgi:hypothetical protein
VKSDSVLGKERLESNVNKGMKRTFEHLNNLFPRA